MSFDSFNFDVRLISGIRAAGYDNPTPIQGRAIPAVLEGLDVMGLAQTGTGKTAAFVLPVLQRLLEREVSKKGPVRVLVLSPTRELAIQIHETFISLGRQTGIRSGVVYGGVGLGNQIRDVKKVTVVTGCPGRLLDLLDRGEIDLSSVDTLILDEADRMLDMGFMPDVVRIISSLPVKRQNLMFSATMPESVSNLADEILNDPQLVKVANTVPVDGVEHICCPVPVHLKQSFLKAFLSETEHERVLVFVRTKRWARRLAQRLLRSGFSAVDLHGDLSQTKRRKALEGFKTGEYTVMVATDLAARGIDCSGISHVINYDMPDSVEIYVHRIGRTARAEQSGTAVVFTAREEQAKLEEIEEALGRAFEMKYFDSFNYNTPKPEFAAPAAKESSGKNNASGKKRKKYSNSK